MTSQYGVYALHAGLARLYAHAHAHAPGYPHAHTRTHTHTSKQSFCFSTATMISEHASVLRYAYIAPLVVLPYVLSLSVCLSPQAVLSIQDPGYLQDQFPCNVLEPSLSLIYNNWTFSFWGILKHSIHSSDILSTCSSHLNLHFLISDITYGSFYKFINS